MNILFIIRVKILVLIKGPIMLTIEPRMVIKCSACSSIYFNICYFGIVFGAIPNHKTT